MAQSCRCPIQELPTLPPSEDHLFDTKFYFQKSSESFQNCNGKDNLSDQFNMVYWINQMGNVFLVPSLSFIYIYFLKTKVFNVI